MSEPAEGQHTAPLDISGLTVRQALYVNHLLSGMSGSAAAKAAGYSQPETTSYKLQRHPLVSAALRGRLAALTLSADAALAQDSEIAKAPWQDYLSVVKGRVVCDHKVLLADGYGFCIKGVKETKYGQVVEFEDAAAARERLERHHGAFTERVDITSGGQPLPPALVGMTADDLRLALAAARADLADPGGDQPAGDLPDAA